MAKAVANPWVAASSVTLAVAGPWRRPGVPPPGSADVKIAIEQRGESSAVISRIHRKSAWSFLH
jgi:hypothetical protein